MTATDHAARTFTSEFALGEFVFLRVNTERCQGMVTIVHFTLAGHYFGVCWDGGSESSHYAAELTREFEPDFTG